MTGTAHETHERGVVVVASDLGAVPVQTFLEPAEQRQSVAARIADDLSLRACKVGDRNGATAAEREQVALLSSAEPEEPGETLLVGGGVEGLGERVGIGNGARFGEGRHSSVR